MEGVGLGPNLTYIKYLILLCFRLYKILAFGLVRKHLPEPVPTEAQSPAVDPDATFVQEILDVAQ